MPQPKMARSCDNLPHVTCGRRAHVPPVRLAGLALVLAACGSDPASAPVDACPPAAPSACPDPKPTYTGEVAPILEAKCVRCHAPGGEEASVPLADFDEVSARAQSLAGQVQACAMPPAGEGELTLTERQALLGWFGCGKPR